MNMPLVLLNRRRRGGAAAFSPAGLFALAEPGVWYDPSDVANLAWRRNLLTFTEQFDNAVWSFSAANVTYSANAGSSPIGGTTADRLVSSSSTWNARNNLTLAAATHTFSVWVKSNTGVSQNFGLYFSGASNPVGSYVATTDWQRFELTGTVVATATGVGFYNGTSGQVVDLLIWGAQLELGSVATDYQRISDVNTEVIERFPSATLFQDTAGTTPVTTPGQTVALALDKSKGLVLGSELVTNGDFATDTAWSKGAGVTISGGVANFPGGTITAALFQNMGAVRFRVYRIQVLVSGTGGLTVNFGGGSNITVSLTNGLNTIQLSPTDGATNGNLVFSTTGFTGTIDNISVKELPGFHATQATLASRPTYGIVPLGGRRNLLTRTEEFNDAAWVKDGSTVSANSTAAPDVATTADTVTATAASSVHSVRSVQQTIVSGANNAFSVYVKKNTSRYVWLSLQGVNIAEYATAVFDLDGGTSSATQTAVGSTSGTIASTSMTSVGSGWYRLTIVASLLETGCFPFIGLATAATGNTFGAYGTISFSAVGTESVYLWGAQLETGSSATNYQRVGSAFDVTEAGVASLSYLSFDGVDDFLITPTITPGIDKAQVFAGVRKLSDAAAAILAEFSATTSSNAGSFYLAAPNSTTQEFAFLSGGSRRQADTTAVLDNAAFVSPVSAVITSTGDISQDQTVIRGNGVVYATATGDQGTGNFLAYPLYIGRRGGATLPFNGQLYSLLVRFGTNLDAGTITSTETWVNQRTGAYT